MPLIWSYFPSDASFMALAAKYSSGRQSEHLSFEGSTEKDFAGDLLRSMERSISYIHLGELPPVRVGWGQGLGVGGY